jgi:hypothetical protein
MAAFTPSIRVFLGRPIFLLYSGIHSTINDSNYPSEITYSISTILSTLFSCQYMLYYLPASTLQNIRVSCSVMLCR